MQAPYKCARTLSRTAICFLFGIGMLAALVGVQAVPSDDGPKDFAGTDPNSEASRSIPDTSIQRSTPSDSDTIQSENGLNQSWWKKNEPQLIGSLGAGLVAVIAVLLTNYLSIRREQRKSCARQRRRHEIYIGLLRAIDADLINHEILSGLLEKELSAVEKRTRSLKDLDLKLVSVRIPLDFVRECRLKMLEHDDCNMALVSNLTSYIGSCSLLNRELDQNTLPKMVQSRTGIDMCIDGVGIYFAAVTEHIGILKDARRLRRDEISQLV